MIFMPKKVTEELRKSSVVAVRLTNPEAERLRRKAKFNGLSQSELIRQIVTQAIHG